MFTKPKDKKKNKNETKTTQYHSFFLMHYTIRVRFLFAVFFPSSYMISCLCDVVQCFLFCLNVKNIRFCRYKYNVSKYYILSLIPFIHVIMQYFQLYKNDFSNFNQYLYCNHHHIIHHKKIK